MAARLCGVKVKCFSIGFGKHLIKRKLKSGTVLAFSMIPLGGFVSLVDEREGSVDKADLPFAFNRKPLWQRCIILIAGCVFNIILAIAILALLYGMGIKTVPPVIAGVEKNSIAMMAGFQSGDEILTVGGIKTSNWPLTLLALISHSGDRKPIRMGVKRAGGDVAELKLNVRHFRLLGLKPDPIKSVGFILPKTFTPVTLQLPLASALLRATKQTVRIVALNTMVLKKILTGYVSFQALGGPLIIFKSANVYFLQGIKIFLQFVALFSIAVGVVNLLPIPGLDGGQILYCVIEKIRNRPISLAWQLLLFRLSMCVLFIVLMQLIANDLRRMATPPGIGHHSPAREAK